LFDWFLIIRIALAYPYNFDNTDFCCCEDRLVLLSIFLDSSETTSRGTIGGLNNQCAPSTTSTSPEIKDPAELHKNMAVIAMSNASPILPKGICSVIKSLFAPGANLAVPGVF
jgi:hypothetical protein